MGKRPHDLKQNLIPKLDNSSKLGKVIAIFMRYHNIAASSFSLLLSYAAPSCNLRLIIIGTSFMSGVNIALMVIQNIESSNHQPERNHPYLMPGFLAKN